MAESPLVSVIVPTYNSAEYLRRCLMSVDRQSYDPIEIIVVDNYSVDRTREIAGEFTQKVYTRGSERCAQTNFGFQKADGKYLYRVDSDFVLTSGVIEKAVERCESGADAVCIHNTSDPTVSFWSRIRKFERDFYKRDSLNVAARFFRRAVIEDIGGFDEDLIAGEDYDLHNRILKEGYEIEAIDPQEVHLGEPKNLREILEKHYSYGKSVSDFIDKNPNRGTKQMNPIRPSYIREWHRFVANPILTVGFIVYQTIRFAAATVGLVVSKFNCDQNHHHIRLDESDDQQEDSGTELSIVVPTYNRERKLRRLLRSLEETSYPKEQLEVLVVNDCPSHYLAALETDFESVRVFENDEEHQLAECRNIGLREAKGEFVFFIDDDNIVHRECLNHLTQALRENPEVGVVGPTMLYANRPDLIWCAGSKFTYLTLSKYTAKNKRLSEFSLYRDRSVDFFPNAYAVRQEIPAIHHASVLPFNWTEPDFCNQVKTDGWDVMLVPEARIFHDIAYDDLVTRLGDFKTYDQARSRIVYRKMYGDRTDIILFWLIVFPISTFYYLLQFIKSENDTRELLSAYVLGTWRGATF